VRSVSVPLMLKLMEELLALHRSLHEISEQKRQALLGNRIDELLTWVNRESRIIKEMAGKQTSWCVAVANVLAERGIHPESSMMLADIAMMIRPEDGREDVLRLQGQLLEAIRRVKEANEQNRKLIEQSLEYVQYILDAMAGSTEIDITYEKPAHAPKTPEGGTWARFDARA